MRMNRSRLMPLCWGAGVKETAKADSLLPEGACPTPDLAGNLTHSQGLLKLGIENAGLAAGKLQLNMTREP